MDCEYRKPQLSTKNHIPTFLIQIAIICGILLSVIKVTAQEQGKPVVVYNGDFEQKLANWEGPNNAAQLATNEAHGGKYSLALRHDYVYQPPSRKQLIRADSLHDYHVSIWIKCSGCKPNSVSLMATAECGATQEDLHDSGWLAGTTPKYVHDEGQSPALIVTGNTHGWQRFEATIPAYQLPDDTQALLIYLRHDAQPNPTGTAYFDDLTAKQTQSKLRNLGFEESDNSWSLSKSVQIVSQKTAEGKRCLRIIHGEAVQSMKITPGARYRLTVRIRTVDSAENTSYILTRFRSRNQSWGKAIGSVRVRQGRNLTWAVIATGGSHEWHTYSTVVQAPANAAQILIILHKEPDDGICWFDDIQIVETNEPAVTANKVRKERMKQLLPPAPTRYDKKAIIAKIMALAETPSPAHMTLASQGKAACRIYIRSAEQPIEFHAAVEMAEYLRRMTGVEFTPLAHEGTPVGGPLIVIGRNNQLAQNWCSKATFEQLGDDGFIIRTIGRHLLIAGNKPRGTLYGVYYLLDRYCGIRWFSPEYTYVPKLKTLSLPRLNEIQIPRFAYREIFTGDADLPEYNAHNLLNGKSHHREVWTCEPGIDSWATWWGPGGHNLHRLVPDERYHAGGQLAMMNENVRRIAAKSLVQILKELPQYRNTYYKIGQEDRGWSPDTASLQYAQRYGGALSAPYLDMVLDIARRVRKELPDAKFCASAYQWSRRPPQGMNKVPKYILMQVSSIEADFSHSLGDNINKSFAEDLAGWCKLADKVLIWDYITNFGSYLQPHPNLYAMCHSIQWLAKQPRVIGYFGQGAYGTCGAEFAELRAWVAARLLWDPTQDPAALIDEFVKGYYGPAAGYIEQYIALMHEAVRKTGSNLSIRTLVTAPYLSWDVMQQADELFEKAEQAVRSQVGFLRRVQTTRIGVDYVILLRRADFAKRANQKGMPWATHHATRLARFKRYVELANITDYGEDVGSLKALFRCMEIKRRTPEVPTICRGIPTSNWIDFQDLSLRRYADAEIIEDRLASDYGAIRMPGNKPDWGIQMRLDNLPAGAKWRLYVSVRVDPGKGKPQETAIQFGVHPGVVRVITVKEVADGRYHTFSVPGAWSQDAGAELWFSPPNSTAVRHIYIDRVVAIRTP